MVLKQVAQGAACRMVGDAVAKPAHDTCGNRAHDAHRPASCMHELAAGGLGPAERLADEVADTVAGDVVRPGPAATSRGPVAAELMTIGDRCGEIASHAPEA